MVSFEYESRKTAPMNCTLKDWKKEAFSCVLHIVTSVHFSSFPTGTGSTGTRNGSGKARNGAWRALK